MKKANAVLICFLSLIFVISSNAQNTTGSIPQYELAIRLSPDAHRLEGGGTIVLPASKAPRDEISLLLSELMPDFRVEIIEPAASAEAVKVEKMTAGGKNIKWIIRPARPIPSNKNVRLRFSYSGGGEKIANQFYVGKEVSFGSAWGTNWYPLVEGANDKGIGSIEFSVPAGQTVYATGKQSGSAEEKGLGKFRFKVAQPTYFSFAAGQYTVTRRDASVPVAAYLLRPRQNTEQYLEGVSKVLDALTQEFGKYQFDEFALVEIPREIAVQASFNAAAVQGFILMNSRAFDAPDVKYLLNFFGHEFAHQWFPNTVALKTPPGLYMEEALAEYGGLRVVETLAGAADAEEYRRTGFKFDPGYSAQGYFKLVDAGIDYKLSDLQPKLEHHNLAYNKGFLVIDMLAREIGREKFRRILHDINRRYAFKGITWTEFLRAVETGANKNLKWFYNQWFERTGAPDFQVTWRQKGKKLSGIITQAAPFYQLNLEIEAKNKEGQTIVRQVKINQAKTEFSFPVDFQVETVTLDPHFLILHRISQSK
jgi:hypothetical protein